MGVGRFKRHGSAIYKTPAWAAVRLEVKRRDGWKCVQCGGVGRLEVDHKKPLRSHPELAFDPHNLQTLCGVCHARKTRIEIGLGEVNPAREAWKSLLRKELPKCLNR
jgi:5-methylcytosine-specific restriction protein A